MKHLSTWVALPLLLYSFSSTDHGFEYNKTLAFLNCMDASLQKDSNIFNEIYILEVLQYREIFFYRNPIFSQSAEPFCFSKIFVKAEIRSS